MRYLALIVLTLCSSSPLWSQTLLVANKSEASVTLFSLPEARVVATLPTGEGPHEVGVSPDGGRAIITDYGTRDQPGSTLTLVDIPSARVIGTLQLPEGARPHGVEWLDERRAAVTAEGISSLLLVDVDAMAVTATIRVDQAVAHMVAASLPLGRAFVANIGSGTATAIDLVRESKLGDLPAGEGTEGIALARGGTELWLSNRAAGTLTVYDSASLEKLAQIEMPGFPIRVEADDARGVVYVSLAAADAVAIVDVAARKMKRPLNFDIQPDRERKTLFGDALPDSSIPVGIMLSGDGEHLFVAHTNAHVVSVYQADTLRRERVIATGLEPDGMGWSPR